MGVGVEPFKLIYHRTTKINSKFINPWKNFGLPTRLQALKWIITRKSFNFPTIKEIKNHPLLNPYPIDHSNNDGLLSTNDYEIKYTWITHSTVLVSFNGFNVLTDPFFSGIVGPFFVRLLSNFNNCKSHGLLPLTIDQLPQIDAVVISHDHFDHLDLISVKQLHSKFGDNLIWFTPINYKKWFKRLNIENVVELEWWQEALYNKSLKTVTLKSHIPHFKRPLNNKIQISVDDHNLIVLSLCPCQHWCGRNPFLVDRRLWGSWVIRSAKHSFFFGGDTGYNPIIFKAIGHRYGPFDISAIPIGAYKPEYIMKNEHLSPYEAVLVHNDLKSIKSFGIHWGGFHFSDEGFFQPLIDLEDAKRNTKLHPNSFVGAQIGRTYTICK